MKNDIYRDPQTEGWRIGRPLGLTGILLLGLGLVIPFLLPEMAGGDLNAEQSTATDVVALLFRFFGWLSLMLGALAVTLRGQRHDGLGSFLMFAPVLFFAAIFMATVFGVSA